jgi:hypothetical protein
MMLRWPILWFLLALPVAAQTNQFLADLQALTRVSHRLAGTTAGRAAADHLQRRLQEIGVKEVFPLDLPVWQTRVAQCELTVNGQTVPLLPVRPNVMVPPTTPDDGLTGPLLYARRGELADYGSRSAAGAIVVLDSDSFDNWQMAFMMGAKAVVFLGNPTSTAQEPKHAPLPVNLVRLYAPPETQAALDLRRDWPAATVTSQVPWELGTGRNLVAVLPGTDPVLDRQRQVRESIVLAAHYDTYGVIPQDSPGARGAANVAALLEVAQYFLTHRPRRDVVLLFLDNQAQFHAGARRVYDTLMASPQDAASLHREHRAELEFVTQVEAALNQSDATLRGSAVAVTAAFDVLRRQADLNATDHRQDLRQLRLTQGAAEPKEQPAWEQRKQLLEQRAHDWDNARRAIQQKALDHMVPALYTELRDQCLAIQRRRLTELREQLRMDAQQQTLRDRLGDRWIALHVTYNFSADGPTWGVVAGDYSLQPWFSPQTGAVSADAPGYYGRVFSALRTAAAGLPPANAPHPDSLVDPLLGLRFTSGRFVSSGYAAGLHGVYNISLVTGHDRRLRDGQPADTLANLDWPVIQRQAAAARQFLKLVANGTALSLPRTFSAQAFSAVPRWQDNRSVGNYVGLMTSGSVAEDRPARGALVALWPNSRAGDAEERNWTPLSPALALPDFDRVSLEAVDSNGRFGCVGLRKDLLTGVVTCGALFDPQGRVLAIVNRDRLVAQAFNQLLRVNLIPARGFPLPFPLLSEVANSPLRVIDGAADADLIRTRSLVSQSSQGGLCYLYTGSTTRRIKVFQSRGPVILGATPDRPTGLGRPLDDWLTAPAISRLTAQDLWQLNESRLAVLRARGLSSDNEELLHNQADRLLQAADSALATADREAALAQSTLLSRRVYPQVRETMNDLMHAVVLLLLLTIPFAFALERLTFCASGIYARLAGFAGLFIATFLLLFLMHPGFALAPTPLIIFLAFTIILLSSLVIYIVVRRFRDELRTFQGQGNRLHALQVSRMGTLLAAVNMGMSTMRRRPTRTILTAITVVMLTFTILCFASLSADFGIRVTFEGPAAETTAASVLVRQLDYTALPSRLLEAVSGGEGAGGLQAGQWWLVRQRPEDNPYGVARADTGEALWVDAVLGVMPAELARWPAFAQALPGQSTKGKMQALQTGGVFLPAILQEELRLVVGDPVLLNGRRLTFAGAVDANALQRLKQLDGRSVLPVDFTAAGGAQPAQSQQSLELRTDVETLTQRDFVRIGPDQVAIVSADVARQLGGRLHMATIYHAAGVDSGRKGRELAALLPLPVWTRAVAGVERLIYTRGNEVRGGMALFVPVALGGLIIFGTLLGSISDRAKEIYTFSALGLSPAHVGFLFFAEAAVYAIVGLMGGQLLAQAVTAGGAVLAQHGWAALPALNYSSGHALFASGLVIATVLISAAYPAYRASRSANPGVQRAWRLPLPVGDELKMTFPFTVSAYDITGVVSFLAEHFRAHGDAGLGAFAARTVTVRRAAATGHLQLQAHVALAPFDLGVTQEFTLTAQPSEIPGVDEVVIRAVRVSGAVADWRRVNRAFVRELRKQFLLWRTLTPELIEEYRLETLQALKEVPA